MKKNLLIIVALWVQLCASFAQVETKYFEGGADNASLPSYLQQVVSSSPAAIKLSKTLVTQCYNSFKKEDIEDKNRFGLPIDVNYSIEDGSRTQLYNGQLCTMVFESEEATSLTFVFDNFKLAEGAEMYVVNGDKTVVYGPVTSDSNTPNGFYMTEVIPGSKSSIVLYEPLGRVGESFFTIKRIIHGYKDLFEDSYEVNRGYLDPCCNSIWNDSSNGVAIIYDGYGTKQGCGALVMSTDMFFKPYFLLTYEQIQNNLTSVQYWNYVFRSKRKSCSGNVSDNPITYSGAQLLSYWSDANFALLLLNGTVSAPQNLTWLGWDRSSNVPSSGASVFYYGSELKLALKNSSLSSSGDYWRNYSWDSGDFNNKCKGAPFFNQDKRIVGSFINQIAYGYDGGWLTYYRFNKFSNSWTGNGTNSTRLSNWLDPIGTSPTTMNSYHPVGDVSIIGNSRLGDTNVYYVQNLPNDMTVEWSLSDSYYSQNQMFQNAPSSNQCTIIRNSSHEMIGATLTATIKENNVVKQRLSKTVTLYNNLYGTYYNGVTTKNLSTSTPLYVKRNANLSFQSQNFVGATVTHEGDATVSSFSFNSSTGTANFYLSSLGTCLVKAIFDGVQYALPFIVTDNLNQLNLVIGDGQIEASLMSVGEEGTRDLSSDDHVTELGDGEPLVWTLEVYTATMGEKVFSQTVEGSSFTIDTTSWKPGVYVVRAVIGDEVLNEKVVVN